MSPLFIVRQGKHGEAGPLYKCSLAIREEVLGPENPEAAKWLSNRAKLLMDQVRGARLLQEDLCGCLHMLKGVVVQHLFLRFFLS